MAGTPFDLQLLNLCAALLLLLSFAMLAQRRIVTLVNLLAVQGALLFVATLLLAWRTGEHHLYLSAALTLALKVRASAVAAAPAHPPPAGLLGYRATAQHLRHDARRPAGRRLCLRSGPADRRAREHRHSQLHRHRASP